MPYLIQLFFHLDSSGSFRSLSTQSTMGFLAALPNELVIEVATHLRTSSLNILSQTSRWIHEVLTSDLYKRSAEQDAEKKDYAMIWAVKVNNMAALKKMIPYNTLLMATAALRMAVELGNEEVLEILLHGGADPEFLGAITDEEMIPKNQLRRWPLLNASSCGHLNIVKSLVARWPHVLKKSADIENNANNNNTRRIRAFEKQFLLAAYLYHETKLTIPSIAAPQLFRHALGRPNVEVLKWLYLKRHEFTSDPAVGSLYSVPKNRTFHTGCLLEHTHEFVKCLWVDG
ncbi:uncharacterized protein BDV14DRAFT_103857 [Aspergillus stella-maris]|uniref:uncharacterized protein n=1 Tax=Aspergillus stella-maris TaxID=1810926 RepID=UPI003CCDA42D